MTAARRPRPPRKPQPIGDVVDRYIAQLRRRETTAAGATAARRPRLEEQAPLATDAAREWVA